MKYEIHFVNVAKDPLVVDNEWPYEPELRDGWLRVPTPSDGVSWVAYPSFEIAKVIAIYKDLADYEETEPSLCRICGHGLDIHHPNSQGCGYAPDITEACYCPGSEGES